MTTEGASLQSRAASDTAELVKEHSHAFQNRPNYTQTDSEPVTGARDAIETAPETKVEATKPAVEETINTTTESKPAAEEPQKGSPIGDLPAANDSKVSVGPKNETATGEKRDLDTTLAPTTDPAEDAKEQNPVPLDERDVKKQKKDDQPLAGSNGTAATSSTDNGQKKASRPKKDKIKEAMSKLIPDGIGINVAGAYVGRTNVAFKNNTGSEDGTSVDQKFYLDPIVSWLYGPGKRDLSETENIEG